jgi:hypothetical protein
MITRESGVADRDAVEFVRHDAQGEEDDLTDGEDIEITGSPAPPDHDVGADAPAAAPDPEAPPESAERTVPFILAALGVGVDTLLTGMVVRAALGSDTAAYYSYSPLNDYRGAVVPAAALASALYFSAILWRMRRRPVRYCTPFGALFGWTLFRSAILLCMISACTLFVRSLGQGDGGPGLFFGILFSPVIAVIAGMATFFSAPGGTLLLIGALTIVNMAFHWALERWPPPARETPAWVRV